MTSVKLLDRPIRELAAIEPVMLSDRASVLDALAALQDEGSVVLVDGRGGPSAVIRADIELLLPSPATLLARHELVDRVDRVALREAVRHETPTVQPETSVSEAIAVMRDAHWRPLVVLDRGTPRGVHTAASLLAAVGDAAPAAPAAPTAAITNVPLASDEPNKAAARRAAYRPVDFRRAGVSAFSLPLLMEAQRRREGLARAGDVSGVGSDLRVLAGWLAGAVAGARARLRRG